MDPRTYGKEGKLYFVNGVWNTVADHRASLQSLANRTGSEVVGIYNASDGTVEDLSQVSRDKLGAKDNPTTKTLASGLYKELQAGRSPHVVAHSQGALITSNALSEVRDRLIKDGLKEADAEKALSRVKVETFGGAAQSYPDGPKYVHYVNLLDPIVRGAGLQAQGLTPSGAQPGRGAKVLAFSSFIPGLHSFADPYLPKRQPFDQVYGS
ncbi:hypothetical protein F0U60_15250 [Archangium minus]|uniref:Alpha/beta hydrolase n=1 Tax=Archangium minus TaxID=83450 RepID=A0ABY9WND7_9BACT|nr:hypothetical protein F0U60_15250 [Archangium minus]